MSLDREAVVSWYRRNRERSRALFDLLTDDAFYSQPIALRHPIVFYAGHLPAFSFNTLVKRGLGCPGIDERLETLFARGIDPSPDAPALMAQATPPSLAQPEPREFRRDIADRPPPRRRQSAKASAKAEVPGAEADGPGDTANFETRPTPVGWPGRDEVAQFAAEADRRVLDALEHGDVERPGHPLLDRADAVFTILEHEAMHQETLLYLWQRLPFAQKKRPAGYRPVLDAPIPPVEWIEVPEGRATLGVNRDQIPFGWDNELPSSCAGVPSFAIQRHDVTNAQFLEFVNQGGYEDERWWTPEDWQWIEREAVRRPLFWEREQQHWMWRGMFDRVRLPLSWPVYVSHAEAAAYARWSDARLPTEAEYQRAAFGSPDRERPHPWGDDPPTEAHGVFDFSSWDPEPAGTHPLGASAWGIEDLVGNGWEWTSTTFAPFPGFRAMPSYPEYSADFFDGDHFVMKGASPVTARELIRPTLRNWFRAHYPYVYATFRCAKNIR
jgi:iron(II)-dependent oxidoreductase